MIILILEPPQTAKVEKKTLYIEEQGVKLRLTVVDTPGRYLTNFYKLNRKAVTRFFSASGHIKISVPITLGYGNE